MHTKASKDRRASKVSNKTDALTPCRPWLQEAVTMLVRRYERQVLGVVDRKLEQKPGTLLEYPKEKYQEQILHLLAAYHQEVAGLIELFVSPSQVRAVVV